MDSTRQDPVTNDGEEGALLDDQLLEHLDIEILEKVAEGETVVVFLGRQLFLDRIVAVKVSYSPDDPGNDRTLQRFSEEAKVLASLTHPGIVACHHAGVSNRGQQYLVMEFIDGPNLRTLVERRGPLAEKEALQVLRKLVLALQYALRQNIIHCALRPSNVLLDPDHSADADKLFPFEPKLSDLGIARSDRHYLTEESTLTEKMLASLLVLSPEQLASDAEVDYRSDVYALGCLFHFLLTKSYPFSQNNISSLLEAKLEEEYPSLRQIAPSLSKESEGLIQAMLSPSRNGRPGYEALLSRIDSQLDAVESDAKTGSPRFLMMIAIVAAIGIAAAITTVMLSNRSTTPQELRARGSEASIKEEIEAAPSAADFQESDEFTVASLSEPEPELAIPDEPMARELPANEIVLETVPEEVEQLDPVPQESILPPLDMAALTQTPLTPVAPTDSWRAESFEALAVRLPQVTEAVIYLRLTGDTVGTQFERDCLLHEDVQPFLVGKEKIFVNVTAEQSQQMKALLSVDTAPALVVYRGSSSMKVLPVGKKTNLTDLGIFLMGAQ